MPAVQMQRLARQSSVTHWHWKWPLGVVAERTGQQPGAGQHLEAVADADHRLAAGDERAAARRRRDARAASANMRPAPSASA